MEQRGTSATHVPRRAALVSPRARYSSPEVAVQPNTMVFPQWPWHVLKFDTELIPPPTMFMSFRLRWRIVCLSSLSLLIADFFMVIHFLWSSVLVARTNAQSRLHQSTRGGVLCTCGATTDGSM